MSRNVMATASTPREWEPYASSGGEGTPALRVVRWTMEAGVLALACLSPWAYGAVHPGFEFLMDAGLAGLLLLWGVRMILEGKVTWQRSPVALCLAGLYLVGVCQVVPLPGAWLQQLAPATARYYDRLLPAAPEVLPDGAGSQAALRGATISFAPGATRAELTRLLAVFLLFALVLQNVASPASLRRLSIAATANGALLSLVGILQFFTSPHNVLYWTYPSGSSLVFGPFICRNHFPFYVNLCAGLGLGLLLEALGARRGPRHSFARFLQPDVLALSGALALMMAGVCLCLSRGGVLALLGGAGVASLVLLRGNARSRTLGAVILALGLTFGLLSWFGLRPVQERLATLWAGQGYEDRVPLWSRTLPLGKDFPVWGTGLGTFQYVEPLRRQPGDVPGLYDHAHNEYLEALVEGGVVRLALILVAIALVFRFGFRAARPGAPVAGLALGALVAFTTVVVHSAGDFGVHLPAVAFLATVVGAQLCALGEGREGRTSREPIRAGVWSLRLGGLAPLAGAALALVLGILLTGAGWTAYQVDNLRLAAFRSGRNPEAGGRERQIRDLEEAARLAPDSVAAHAELAEAQFAAYDQAAEAAAGRNRLALAAQAVGFSAWGDPGAGWGSALAFAPRLLGASAAWEHLVQEEDAPAREYLTSALGNALEARDLCPLLAESQLRIAAHAGQLAAADPREAYLERARWLAPADADLWYLCGLQELADHHPELAWKSWRHCLELSIQYLPEILDRAARQLEPPALLAQILPEDPEAIKTAALRLYPGPEAAGCRLFLAKALNLLDQKPKPLGAADLHLRAWLLDSLGREAEAVPAYQAALARDPGQAEWHFELAQILYRQKRFEETRHELLLVLAEQPENGPARSLLKAVWEEKVKTAHNLSRAPGTGP